MNFKQKISSWLYKHPAIHPIFIFRPGVFRLITGPFRVLPDFLIIGAGKSGTTSLYNYLIKHPNIHTAMNKELDYFFRRWTTYYRPNFPSIFSKFYATKIKKVPFVTGESTPFYLIHPLVPKQVKNKIPRVKIIILLRNPIERAHSQYNHQFREKNEKLSFEKAIESEKIKTKEEWMKLNEWGEGNRDHERYSYLEGGLYYKQIKGWMEQFPEKQFLIINAEKFFTNPSVILNQVFEFLGVPPVKVHTTEKFNVGTYLEMQPKTREFLSEFFKPHNEDLYKLLKKDFRWN